jgi:hypothetical protein
MPEDQAQETTEVEVIDTPQAPELAILASTLISIFKNNGALSAKMACDIGHKVKSYTDSEIAKLKSSLTNLPDFDALIKKVNAIDNLLDGDAEQDNFQAWIKAIERLNETERLIGIANGDIAANKVLIERANATISELNNYVNQELAKNREYTEESISDVRDELEEFYSTLEDKINILDEDLSNHIADQTAINGGFKVKLVSYGERLDSLDVCCDESKTRLRALERENIEIDQRLTETIDALRTEAATRISSDKKLQAQIDTNAAATRKNTVALTKVPTTLQIIGAITAAANAFEVAANNYPCPEFVSPTDDPVIIIDPIHEPIHTEGEATTTTTSASTTTSDSSDTEVDSLG